MKPLGRMHLWWLKQIDAAGRLAIGDYSGTVQGRALQGLHKRGLIQIEMAFESGINLTVLTAAGRDALAASR